MNLDRKARGRTGMCFRAMLLPLISWTFAISCSAYALDNGWLRNSAPVPEEASLSGQKPLPALTLSFQNSDLDYSSMGSDVRKLYRNQLEDAILGLEKRTIEVPILVSGEEPLNEGMHMHLVRHEEGGFVIGAAVVIHALSGTGLPMYVKIPYRYEADFYRDGQLIKHYELKKDLHVMLWLGVGLPRMQSAPGRLDALALEYILIDLREEGEI